MKNQLAKEIKEDGQALRAIHNYLLDARQELLVMKGNWYHLDKTEVVTPDNFLDWVIQAAQNAKIALAEYELGRIDTDLDEN